MLQNKTQKREIKIKKQFCDLLRLVISAAVEDFDLYYLPFVIAFKCVFLGANKFG